MSVGAGGGARLDERTVAALRAHARTSPLALWLNERFDHLASLGRIGRWQAICDLVAAEGLTNGKGEAITPAVVSAVWSRLKRARSRAVSGVADRSERHRIPEPVRLDVESTGIVRPAAPLPSPRPVRSMEDPPQRSEAEARELIAVQSGFMEVRYKKRNGFHRDARALEDELRARATAIGLPLGARICEPRDDS